MKELLTVIGGIAIGFGLLWAIVVPGAIGGATIAVGTVTAFIGGFF